MTFKIASVVAALLFSGALGAYSNANITYDKWLDCTSCIRGGYNFCLYIGGSGNGTVASWDCQNATLQPNNTFINKTTPGAPNGWLCSYGLKDQMNSIVNGCRP